MNFYSSTNIKKQRVLIDLKNDIEELAIIEDSNENEESLEESLENSVSPLINMVVSTYYKGTGVWCQRSILNKLKTSKKNYDEKIYLYDRPQHDTWPVIML